MCFALHLFLVYNFFFFLRALFCAFFKWLASLEQQPAGKQTCGVKLYVALDIFKPLNKTNPNLLLSLFFVYSEVQHKDRIKNTKCHTQEI